MQNGRKLTHGTISTYLSTCSCSREGEHYSPVEFFCFYNSISVLACPCLTHEIGRMYLPGPRGATDHIFADGSRGEDKVQCGANWMHEPIWRGNDRCVQMAMLKQLFLKPTNDKRLYTAPSVGVCLQGLIKSSRFDKKNKVRHVKL